MASKFVGQARRTSLVTTYGVGSLFPTESDSMMICGLDDWPKGPPVLEPRLAESLGVSEFRSPAAGRKTGDIPVVRFPEWAFCPGCRALAPHWVLANDSRRCKTCNTKVSPSRFIVCCERGHIDDFPFRAWVHQPDHVPSDGHDLRFKTRGMSSGLSDVIVECSCGRSRSMFGSFDFSALRNIKGCSGRRPWLPDSENETCSASFRTLQRGSSNAWFAETRSAISIPSVQSRARAFASRKFRDANATADPHALASMFQPPEGCSVDDVAAAIIDLRIPAASRKRPSQQDLRADEYRALVNGLSEGIGTDEFLCTNVDISSAGLPGAIIQLSRVSRLREVRALAGFSRVTPMTGDVPSDENPQSRRAPLASSKVDWLPALEVLGEGIFLRLDAGQLDAWSQTPFAAGRVRSLLEAQDQLSPRSMANALDVSARRLVLHSLAHALIDECSLTAGYPTASLRERLYTHDNQSGVLIYTATADSAGSLGGLAALSDPHRFASVLTSALQRASWCTSDPVCLEAGPSGVDGLNLAACHACLLLPETSCEGFNLVLDRGTLVGTTDSPAAGLFSTLASGGH